MARSLNPLDPANISALSRAIEAGEEARRQADPNVQARVRETIATHEASKQGEVSSSLTGDDDKDEALFI